ncbi:MAG TPA: hypothetical protein VFC46_15725, partial [Humisphaera sp.]|nr:hypothetical protein [Humisphaera sp.]
MTLTKFAPIAAVMIALLALAPARTLAGDAARARRDLMAAKDNAETGRWDDLNDRMKKVAADMEGLSESEKKPLLAEVAAIKAIVTKSIEEDVTKRLDKAAKADLGMAKLDIGRAAMRLNSDEAKNLADPAAMDKLRARLASMTGGSAPAPT